MKNKKIGFTLAEVLIVLALLGLLAAMLLPAIASVRPNRDKAMFRKAYYIAERMIYELINDEALYPAAEGVAAIFDKTDTISYNGDNYGGTTKFCRLFARKVNTIDKTDNCEGANYNGTPLAADTGKSGQYSAERTAFTTTDGVAWYLPITDFAPVATDPAAPDEKEYQDQTIYVDINGEKEPNCIANTNNCLKPDIFQIKFKVDGKMYVEGEKEQEYLKSSTNLR